MLEIVKAFTKLLNDKRGEMVAQAFGKLLLTANQLVGGILPSPLMFYDGEIGRMGTTGFHPHRVFSGTEKALTYIAIAVALSVDAPLRLVILDELGRLDDSNRIKVQRQLCKAVDYGVIDQFLIVGTELQRQAEGVKVIQL